MKHQLTGKKLTLVSISRNNLFDANYVGCCDNCGKIIVNIATVKDQDGKSYDIGLDCKKTLIDKPVIDQMLQDTFMGKYNAKDYKRQTSEAEKFLKLCSYPDVDIEIDYAGNDVLIYDRKPNTTCPTINGNIIYMQNLGYLNKIGLKPFITALYNKTSPA